MTEETKQQPAEGYHTILTLSEPARLGSDVRTVINLRKPKSKNLRKLPIDMSNATMDCILTCAYECSDFDSELLFDDLSGEDSLRIIRLMQDFLLSGQGVVDVNL